jgi:hypothetical protein
LAVCLYHDRFGHGCWWSPILPRNHCIGLHILQWYAHMMGLICRLFSPRIQWRRFTDMRRGICDVLIPLHGRPSIRFMARRFQESLSYAHLVLDPNFFGICCEMSTQIRAHFSGCQCFTYFPCLVHTLYLSTQAGREPLALCAVSPDQRGRRWCHCSDRAINARYRCVPCRICTCFCVNNHGRRMRSTNFDMFRHDD